MRCSIQGRGATHYGAPAYFSLVVAGGRCAVPRRQGEEPGATPGCAGDGAGNGGEAGIRHALPVEAIGRNGDGMALALIVAHQHCAGLELAPWRAAVACQTVQEAAAFPIEAAKGPFLQAASNHSPQCLFRGRSRLLTVPHKALVMSST